MTLLESFFKFFDSSRSDAPAVFLFIQKAYENYYSIISAYSDRVSVRSFCGSSF